MSIAKPVELKRKTVLKKTPHQSILSCDLTQITNFKEYWFIRSFIVENSYRLQNIESFLLFKIILLVKVCHVENLLSVNKGYKLYRFFFLQNSLLSHGHMSLYINYVFWLIYLF